MTNYRLNNYATRQLHTINSIHRFNSELPISDIIVLHHCKLSPLERNSSGIFLKRLARINLTTIIDQLITAGKSITAMVLKYFLLKAKKVTNGKNSQRSFESN